MNKNVKKAVSHAGHSRHNRFGRGNRHIQDRPQNFKGAMKKLLNVLKPFRVSIILVIVFSCASAVFSIVGPKVLSGATDEIIKGISNKLQGTGIGIDFGAVGRIIILLVLIYLMSAFFSYVQGWVMTGVSIKITYKMRKDISEKINRMPLNYFDKTNHGEILSIVTNDIDTISQTLNQSLSQIITAVTSLIGILIMMFSISWIMTLVALCILPVTTVLVSVVVKHSQKYFRQQQNYLGHLNGHIEEMYSNHMVMRAYNGEQKSIKEFLAMNDVLYDSAWKSQSFSGMMMPVMSFVGNLGYVAICVVGGILATRGSVSIGNIQAFIQYVRSFNQPISQIANISNIIQQTAAAAERVFTFLSEEEEKPDLSTALENTSVNGFVEFKNVCFGYDPEKIVIHNFSAKIAPGQKVAIVGPTGAGKTTIVKLLMRFYDLNSGKITIDNIDINDFTRAELRSKFGMVLQDTWLYSGSIMDNIRYGKPSASDEEVIEAAKAAHLHHFIKTLPEGYDTILNEDTSNVSQGQKQLLTVARAMLSNPQILILDEATSSVDTRTEVLIQKAMDDLMKNRTSFIIAHRLSTIKDADMILCMKNGDIVEHGTHLELMEAKGFYYELYRSQFSVNEAV